MGSIRPSEWLPATTILVVVYFGSLAFAADPAADVTVRDNSDTMTTSDAGDQSLPDAIIEELEEAAENPEINPCEVSEDDEGTWLDKSQTMVYKSICGSVAWFYGFFGDRRYDQHELSSSRQGRAQR